MSIPANSTLEEDSTSDSTLGADVKYILVTIIPVTLALSITIVLAFVVRRCWRRRQGSKEYRPVPTKDTPGHLLNERVRKKVQIILPEPPPPKTSITLATNLTKNTPKLSCYCYLPHKSVTTDNSCSAETISIGKMGVAASQAFLCLKMSVTHNRLMVEVQNAVGLPCRADGTPVVPLVKLNVVSREKKHGNRKCSRTQPVSIGPDITQIVDCGSVVGEELEHSILHIEVLDHWAFAQHTVLAVTDFPLDQLKEKPENSFKVPLNIVKSTAKFNAHALISLYNDKAASKLSVTIPKVELSLNDLPSSTDYWIKVVIAKGEKCLVKEKAKHFSVSSDEIHFNKSIICNNVSDITSLSVQCTLITMTTVNFMKKAKILGAVTLGLHTQGQALRHWKDMLNTPNTSIAEWHDLTCHHVPYVCACPTNHEIS